MEKHLQKHFTHAGNYLYVFMLFYLPPHGLPWRCHAPPYVVCHRNIGSKAQLPPRQRRELLDRAFQKTPTLHEDRPGKRDHFTRLWTKIPTVRPWLGHQPWESMYGIFTYISHKNQPNVGKYTIHGSSGKVRLIISGEGIRFFFNKKLLSISLKSDGDSFLWRSVWKTTNSLAQGAFVHPRRFPRQFCNPGRLLNAESWTPLVGSDAHDSSLMEELRLTSG